jgi:hypothetical protein
MVIRILAAFFFSLPLATQISGLLPCANEGDNTETASVEVGGEEQVGISLASPVENLRCWSYSGSCRRR